MDELVDPTGQIRTYSNMSSEQQMQYAKELKAMHRLSEAVAHDVNNLLSGILGYSELLMCEPLADNLRPQIEEISNAGKRIASLIRILLAFGDKYIYRPETLDLNNAILEIEKLISRILGSEIHFLTVKAPELWPVAADPAKMKLALIALAIEMQNLIPDGGKLMFSTENSSDTSILSQSSHIEPRRHVLITATSSGNIAACQIPGFLLKQSSAANGHTEKMDYGALGICELVKLIGGHILLKSISEQELTVRMYLPAAGPNTQ